jgi:hypothetical protein
MSSVAHTPDLTSYGTRHNPSLLEGRSLISRMYVPVGGFPLCFFLSTSSVSTCIDSIGTNTAAFDALLLKAHGVANVSLSFVYILSRSTFRTWLSRVANHGAGAPRQMHRPGRYLGVGTGSPHVLEDASVPSSTYEVPHSTTLFYTILCASRSTRAPPGILTEFACPPETPPPRVERQIEPYVLVTHINVGVHPLRPSVSYNVSLVRGPV